jgi:hypothetical protein
MMNLIKKCSVIFAFYEYFGEDISKNFPSGNGFGKDISIPFIGFPHEKQGETFEADIDPNFRGYMV